MEPIVGNSSSLRPMKRSRDYYSENDYFIVRLPSNLRGSGEPEFHIGTDILNRSNKYADWGGNEVVSRMQKKYCFSPTNAHLDMNVKSWSLSYETMMPIGLPVSRCSSPKNFSCEENKVNNSPFLISNTPSWPPPNVLRNKNNPCNRTASQMEPTNRWPTSQMAQRNTYPVTQFPSPVGIYNPSYIKGPNISLAQNASETFFHNEKNEFNHDSKHLFYPRSQGSSDSESFTEFSSRHSPCNQGSKLLCNLQSYHSDKHLVSTLKNKNPRCLLFVDLRCHKRFLYNLPQCLTADIHVVAYFDHLYKFPVFANAPFEQLVKTECFHVHPDSSTRKAESQQYLINVINRSHRDLPLGIMFVLLTGSNPMICGLIKNLRDSGRPVVAFLPSFDFSEFYSVLKDHTNSSTS